MLKRDAIQAEAAKWEQASSHDGRVGPLMWLGWNVVLVLDEIRYHLRDIAQHLKEPKE